MSFKVIGALCCAILMSVFASAQHGTFTPLQCSGEIPLEFRTVTSVKVQKQQAAEQASTHTPQEKKRISEFLLRSNYMIDELLTSGKVLFGDSLSLYINDVASHLIKDEPELRSQLRFFAVKSNEINAFTTTQGIIFVTTGLIAQIENEAQLAFVIAHEIAHFEKAHNLASVLETGKIYNESNRDHYKGSDTRIKLLSSFSKDMEFQADELGFYRFRDAGYDVHASSSMMDVLQFSFLPFEDFVFNFNVLEFDSLKIPSRLIKEEMTPIPLDDDNQDDSKSSHPNVRSRRELLNVLIAKPDSSAGAKFFFGVDRFNRMHLLAQNQGIHLQLLDQDFILAFYNAYCMSVRYPGNAYYEESMGKALYGISKFKNFAPRKLGDSENVYSHLQRCFFLFEELETEQLNLIAIRYLIYVCEKYHSPFMIDLRNDLIQEGIRNNGLSWPSLEMGVRDSQRSVLEALRLAEERSVVVTDSSTLINNASTGISKYDKLRAERKRVEEDVEMSGYNDHLSMTFHYRAFANMDKAGTKHLVDSLDNLTVAQKEMRSAREQQNSARRVKGSGYALGINRVLFVDPFFFIADHRDGLRLIDSEQRLLEFRTEIDLSARVFDLQYDVLFPKTMRASDLSDYNSMSLLNDWIDEKLSLENDVVEMIPLQTAYTWSVADTYGTDFVCYPGVFSTSQKEPRHLTNYYFLLYNVRSGETIWALEQSVERAAVNGDIHFYIVDFIRQVKKTTE